MIFFISISGFSQGEIDDSKKVFFRNEKSFGFFLNSNGWGVNYRYAKRFRGYAQKHWIFDGDFNVMKHPKEIKLFNEVYATGSRFVYGKYNYAFNIRASVGRQEELFRKFDKRSVSVRFVLLGGASAVFLKPIYYNVYVNYDITNVEKFSTSANAQGILGRASVFKGIDEITVIPGGYLKVGLSFEYSKKDRKLKAVEIGASFEAYPKKIKIMAIEDNSMFFPTLYVSFRFGKVVSGYHIKQTEDEE